MLQALYECGIEPDLLVGASAGALNAAFIASRPQSPATAAQLARIWRGLQREEVFPVSMSALVGGSAAGVPTLSATTRGSRVGGGVLSGDALGPAGLADGTNERLRRRVRALPTRHGRGRDRRKFALERHEADAWSEVALGDDLRDERDARSGRDGRQRGLDVPLGHLDERRRQPGEVAHRHDRVIEGAVRLAWQHHDPLGCHVLEAEGGVRRRTVANPQRDDRPLIAETRYPQPSGRSRQRDDRDVEPVTADRLDELRRHAALDGRFEVAEGRGETLQHARDTGRQRCRT